MIEAVVFDFDGTVFDSETHVYEVLREIFVEHGAELPLDVWGRCVGREPGFFDVVAYLEAQIGRSVDRSALKERRVARFRERTRDAGPRPGIADALAAASRSGLRVGLASSSPASWVHGQLEVLGLRHHFECLRTADDVTRVKPEPDLYLSVLEHLGVAPARALAIEDSPNGALAARRAGMYCLVVPNPVTAGLEFGEHDLRLDTLDGVDLAELLARLIR